MNNIENTNNLFNTNTQNRIKLTSQNNNEESSIFEQNSLYENENTIKEKLTEIYNNTSSSISNNIDDDISFAESLYIEPILDTENTTRNKEIDDYKQNSLEDCWFLSALTAISNTKKGAELIKNSITYTNDGIRITFNGVNKTYTISNEELAKSKEKKEYNDKPTYTSGDDDVIAFELALEKLADYIAENKINFDENNASEFSTDDIINGNSPKFAMKILGLDSDSETQIKSSNEFNSLLNNKNEEYLNNNITSILCSYSSTYTPDNNGNYIQLDKMHTYGVKSISKEDNTISFINPQNSTDEIVLSIDSINSLLDSGDIAIRTYNFKT